MNKEGVMPHDKKKAAPTSPPNAAAGRRKMLQRLGLFATVAYVAPALLELDNAHARGRRRSGSSRPSRHSRASRSSRPHHGPRYIRLSRPRYSRYISRPRYIFHIY